MGYRQIFSDAEKLCLQKLILKYKLANKNSRRNQSQHTLQLMWNRLTQEYNSVETNSKRTVNQLKKCWDNIKTRRKAILAFNKDQKMQTNEDDIKAEAGTNQIQVVLIPEGTEFKMEQISNERLSVGTDTDSDTVYTSEDHTVDTPPQRCFTSCVTEYGAAATQGPENETKAFDEEFQIIKGDGTNNRSERREEALHKLRIQEREWMVKAAEQKYLKMKTEKKAAEELLRYYKAKRQQAELEVLAKNIDK